jgi:hypothetical protein
LATCRIADWQSAERRIFESAADCQSAIRQTASLRYFIYGRTGRFDVVEVPDSLPNIVGQIPLEDLDWVAACRKPWLKMLSCVWCVSWLKFLRAEF